MAKKKETELVEVKSNTGLAVPDFMVEDSRAGTELLSNYIQPPRLKIIQPLTKPPLIDKFNPGDLVLLPNEELLIGLSSDDEGKKLKHSEKLRFVALFFFPKWITYNPMEIRQQHGAIRDQSFDPECSIAFKSKNKTTRNEVCPEMPDKKITHVEVLNYALSFEIEGRWTEPAILQIKSGEHGVGTAFNTLVRSRKAPIFGCVFEAQVNYRSNAKGQWFGLDMMNPQENPWVDNRQQYDAFKEAHETFDKFYKMNAIIMEEDDEGVVDQPSEM